MDTSILHDGFGEQSNALELKGKRPAQYRTWTGGVGSTGGVISAWSTGAGGGEGSRLRPFLGAMEVNK